MKTSQHDLVCEVCVGELRAVDIDGNGYPVKEVFFKKKKTSQDARDIKYKVIG